MDYLVNCTFQDRLTKLDIQGAMTSDGRFDSQIFLTVDGDKTLVDVVQKPPASTERFRIIAGENDTYFSVNMQIFGAPPDQSAKAIVTVRFEGEATSIPGACEFVD